MEILEELKTIHNEEEFRKTSKKLEEFKDINKETDSELDSKTFEDSLWKFDSKDDYASESDSETSSLFGTTTRRTKPAKDASKIIPVKIPDEMRTKPVVAK